MFIILIVNCTWNLSRKENNNNIQLNFSPEKWSTFCKTLFIDWDFERSKNRTSSSTQCNRFYRSIRREEGMPMKMQWWTSVETVQRRRFDNALQLCVSAREEWCILCRSRRGYRMSKEKEKKFLWNFSSSETSNVINALKCIAVKNDGRIFNKTKAFEGLTVVVIYHQFFSQVSRKSSLIEEFWRMRMKKEKRWSLTELVFYL